MATGRLRHIDVLKGIGVVFMVLGHLHYSDLTDTYIYSFHMPLFFIVSGYLFTRKDTPALQQIGKKARTLLIPFIAFGAIYTIIMFAGNLVGSGFHDALHEAYGHAKHLVFRQNKGLPLESALWFLVAMFVASSAFSLVDRLDAKVKGRGFLLGAVCILLFAWGIFGHRMGKLPFCIGPAMVGMGFMWIGHLMKVAEGRKLPVTTLWNAKRAWLIVLLLVIQVVVALYLPEVNMRKCSFPIPLAFLVESVLGTIVYWNIAKALADGAKTGVRARVVDYLAGVSTASMTYICTNHPVIFIFDALFSAAIVATGFALPALVSTLLQAVLVLAALYGLALLFERTPLKVLLGKKLSK